MKIPLSHIAKLTSPLVRRSRLPMRNRSALALLNESPVFDTRLTRLLREHDSIVDSFFADSPFRSTPIQDSPFFSTPIQGRNSFVKPQYEVVNNAKEYKIAIDLPGVDIKDVNVDLDDDGKNLIVSATRETKGDDFTFTSKFLQSFSIGSGVEIENVSAELDNGVLVLTMPKDKSRVEGKRRNIQVNLKRDEDLSIPIDATSAESKNNGVSTKKDE